MGYLFIYLFFLVQALETEVVMITFQKVYDKLSQAFGDVPCDEIGILDEVKEQVWNVIFFFIFGNEF